MTGFTHFFVALIFVTGLAFIIVAMERDPVTGMRKWISRRNLAPVLVAAFFGIAIVANIGQSLHRTAHRWFAISADSTISDMDLVATILLSDAG